MPGVPSVTITLTNGNLEQTAQTADGVAGFVLSGEAVTDKMVLGNVYTINSLAAAAEIGIDDSTNTFAYKVLQNFYAEAATGAELWLMLVALGTTMEDICDKENDYLKKLVDAGGGRIKIAAVSVGLEGFSTGFTGGGFGTASITMAGGLVDDVHAAVPKAQALLEEKASEYHLTRLVLDGLKFSGTPSELTDYKTDDKNRVSILLGNNDATLNASVGLLLGRLANDPVQRNPGRVKTGALKNTTAAYLTDGETVESKAAQLDTIHNKGYILMRNYYGKAGYFFSDDPTLTADTDDYNSFSRGRVIDKVIQVAYTTFVEEILDEIPVASDGSIAPALIKAWEGNIENAINATMTANGEISGVRATLDPNQPVLSTNTVAIQLSVLPVGYGKYIDISLGFTTNLNDE